MHKIHNHPTSPHGPHTTGVTLHWASQYDSHTRILGLGVNSRNSRMVVEMAQIKAGERVLDIGCGTGSLTLTAKRYAGPSGAVHGIDASPEMIDVARKKADRLGSEVVFELGLIEQLAFPDATFDVVISRLVIHHLPADLQRRGFAEVFRVLKPGGRLFIADFRPPSNPVLAHIFSALVGPRMMHSSMQGIPPLLSETGFVEVASGPTRSAFLAFASGKKPASPDIDSLPKSRI